MAPFKLLSSYQYQMSILRKNSRCLYSSDCANDRDNNTSMQERLRSSEHEDAT